MAGLTSAGETDPNRKTACFNSSRSLKELGPGDSLGVGESIWSPNRTANLLVQADGNLVVYRQCDCQVIWDSKTNSNYSRVRPLRMRADGNLVIYDIEDTVIWASGTNEKRFAGARLRLEDTGSLCIEKTRGLCLWRSGGIALCHPAYAPTFEDAQGHPESMGANKSLSTFTMNETGNLQVTYVEKSPVIFKDIQSRSFGNLTTLSADLRLADLGGEIFSPQLNVKRTMRREGDLVLFGMLIMISIRTEHWPLQFKRSPGLGLGYAGRGLLVRILRVNNDGTICIARNGSRCLWTSAVMVYVILCTQRNFDDAKVILWPGERFQRNDTVYSRQKTCRLSTQSDENLVLTRTCDGEKIYSVKNNSELLNKRVIVHGLGIEVNGELMMYTENGWTWRNMRNNWVTPDGANLRLSDDCILCVYKNGACLWTSSGRAYACPANNSDGESRLIVNDDNLPNPAQIRQLTREKSSDLLMREVLESGEALFVGQSLWSPGRNVQLKMEWTGNLTTYRRCDNKSIWSSATSGPTATAIGGHAGER
ncbi:hypothetical protein BV898_18782 [Hypsibius exemplaris]|uniref:Bulb-type lectin domain-containing protein n=1 Tax=Hypsibius exemplaris TaxID=2072580 RepID=A0A9X6RNH1_HYPEX|nr:hypothetical protein BV898_18782 [Hypsibius exemplaris]